MPTTTSPSRRGVLRGGLFGAVGACACVAAGFAVAADAPPGSKFVCPPCGCDSDGKLFDAPGACPSCGMPLIAAPKPEPKPDAPPPPKS
ncbi:hypothetical protein [Phenylobacterium sp.]|uniref:hypothetical protein n=1 Tax=Phenylobacterium sp. TaxID=1871053 RepID=UPI003566FDD4